MRCCALYENLPSIYFTLNSSGEILRASQFAATQLGYSVDELINQSIFRLVYDDDRKKLKQAIANNRSTWASLQATTQNNCQHRVICKDGTKRWVKAIATFVPNCDTHLEILLVWELIQNDPAQDKTEYKQASALKEKLEKYRIMFQAFPIGIAITDETGKLIEANPASKRLFGITIEDYTQNTEKGKNCKIIRPDGTIRPVAEYARVRALKENRIIENLEEGIITGQEISWLSVTAVPIPLENYGVAIAYIDITERKRAEESLRHSEERYRQLFNSGYDAIFVHGFSATRQATQFTTVNDVACQILGYTRNELLKLSPQDTYSPANAVEIPEILEKLFIQKHHLFEMEMLTKNREKVPVEINARLFEMNGQPTVLSIVRDITERKQAEIALHQQFLRERLMAAIQARIRKSLKLTEILNTTVTEVRQFLQTDRVIIYRFEPDWSGIVIVESLDQQWKPMLGRKIQDTCLAQELYITPYTQGYIQAVEDIYTAGFAQCYVDLLAEYQVRANLVVPILQGESLWGLLVAQHCAQTRAWQHWEVELLNQLATGVGIAIQQAELYQQLEAANQQLKRLATLDGLTQLANRRRFDEYMEQEWRRLATEQLPLSLILCDVDFFKLYNDTYGHQAGDEALKQVASALGQTVKRPADLVARYGGEEFAIVLPNTNKHGVLYVAECIHQAIRSLKIVHATSQVSAYITLSIGVANVIPCPKTSSTALVAAADAGLYQAKRAGRDRTVVFNLGD